MKTQTLQLAVILAGGEGRRMQSEDKARLQLGGRPLIRHVIDRLRPQASSIAISCHDRPERFADLGLPILPDQAAERLGPIGGILSALDWAAEHRPDGEFILTVPTDTPFLPPDLVSRLVKTRNESQLAMACAATGHIRHPVIALWPVALRAMIRAWIASNRHYALLPLIEAIGCASAEWQDTEADPFFNINTPDDLAAAETRMRSPAL